MKDYEAFLSHPRKVFCSSVLTPSRIPQTTRLNTRSQMIDYSALLNNSLCKFNKQLIRMASIIHISLILINTEKNTAKDKYDVLRKHISHI